MSNFNESFEVGKELQYQTLEVLPEFPYLGEYDAVSVLVN